MSSDDRERKSKRQKLLSQIGLQKCTNKQLESFLDSIRGQEKTEELFNLPASSVTKEQFRLRYGLISIEQVMPSYDRFGSIEISDETLRTIYDRVTSDALHSTEFQPPSANGEAAIFDRMTRNFGRFTKARSRDWAVSSGVKKSDFMVKYNEDEEVKGSADEGNTSSSSDEEDVMDSPRQHSEFLVYVYKKRHTVTGLRLKIAKDFKGQCNLFQPSVYVIDELRETRTLPKVYRPPVYVLAEDVNKWFYGILEIDGFVKIDDQQNIVSESLEDFPEKADAPINGRFTRSYTRKEVADMVCVWKRTMLLEDMKVPQGFHPVGRFFMRFLESFETPSMFGDRPLGDGALRYLDGTLKIVVGRETIKWTPDDALKAWEARNNIERKAGAAAGLSDDLWVKLHPGLTRS